MATLSEPDPRGPDPTRPMYVRYPWHVMAYIEQTRIHHRHTQRKLAAMAGIQQSTYVGWANTGSMRGHTTGHAHMPRLNNVLTLLDVLGLDLVIRPRGRMDIVDGPPVKDMSIRLCDMCTDVICSCPTLLDGNVDPASTPSNINPRPPCALAPHADPCAECQSLICCDHCPEGTS